MAKQAQKIGPRVTVVFGTIKVVSTQGSAAKKTKPGVKYCYMRKATADYFGLKAAPNAKGPKGKNGRQASIRGSKGSGSIKIPVGSGTKTAGKGKVVYKSIPIPGGANLDSIKAFIKTFTKNKPVEFVTKYGWTRGADVTTK